VVSIVEKPLFVIGDFVELAAFSGHGDFEKKVKRA